MKREIEVFEDRMELNGDKFTIDVNRVSVKNIQSLIDDLDLNYTPIQVFVSWETNTKLRKSTKYISNLIVFNKTDNSWSKKDLTKSRTF